LYVLFFTKHKTSIQQVFLMLSSAAQRAECGVDNIRTSDEKIKKG